MPQCELCTCLSRLREVQCLIGKQKRQGQARQVWEDASEFPNLCLSSLEVEACVMPQVVFKSTVQVSDSGGGGEDVNGGRAARQVRTWPASRGPLARHLGDSVGVVARGPNATRLPSIPHTGRED